MKQLLLFILLVATQFNMYSSESGHFAQTDNALMQTITMADNATYSSYVAESESYKQTKDWRIYKALNITGWCAFGVGVPMTLYGTFLLAYHAQLEEGDPWSGAIVITSVGGALTLSSIPLLIVANHYKKKAKLNNLSLDITNIKTRDYLGHTINKPALSFTYSF
ncbi:MAG: hypothetical protein K2I08_11135 [Muribaculaceae bacterium]|nr:hypothetical protein [Muribaculaceae bacterium]